MNRRELYRSGYIGAINEARRNGVSGPIARAHAIATGYLKAYGYSEPERPDITSGRRSPQRQRELIELWDAGQREGFIGKPARCSKHTVGAAIDVQTDVRGFEPYRQIMRALGARDGAAFDDLGHFDNPNREGYCV
jgi:hypothetical protein